jgi:hypothetical protein
MYREVPNQDVRPSKLASPYEVPCCIALFQVPKPSQANLANDTGKYTPT